MNYPDTTRRSTWLDAIGMFLTLMLTTCVYSYLAKGAP